MLSLSQIQSAVASPSNSLDPGAMGGEVLWGGG